jgi:hypothetical protein
MAIVAVAQGVWIALIITAVLLCVTALALRA